MGLFSGIGSIIGGIFGATQQRRAYNSAINDLRQFQQEQALPQAWRMQGRSDQLTALGRDILTSGDTPFRLSAEAQAMRRNLMSTTGGLSPAAQIAFEDMNRLLKEDAVSTGNLRSGAFAFGQAELGRRVVADELLRQTQLLDLFGRQDLSLNQLGLDAGLGLLQAGGHFGSLSNQALGLAGNITTNIADATIQRGTVNAAQLYGAGAAIGGVVDLGLLAYGGYSGGGLGGLTTALTGEMVRTSPWQHSGGELSGLPTAFIGAEMRTSPWQRVS